MTDPKSDESSELGRRPQSPLDRYTFPLELPSVETVCIRHPAGQRIVQDSTRQPHLSLVKQVSALRK